MVWLLLSLAIAVITGVGVMNWNRSAGMRFVAEMGSGINLGNSLDSTNLKQYRPDATDLEYEEFWGNPKITKEQFEAVREAGFGTVRIPVTWEEHMDEEGNISEVWMNRVAEVVDMALASELYVILDTHHEEWLDLQTEREEEITALYAKVWSQIAGRFAGYGQKLLFEGMNEPRLRDSEHEWDEGTSEMRAMINRLNDVFVDTVRAAGGENTERYLLICPYATNTEPEALEDLEIPEGNIIVAVHMYLPYMFCQKEDGTAVWDAEKSEDSQRINEVFADLQRLFTKRKIPVMITEFGCKDKNNQQERIEWIQYYRELAQKQGITCVWWDNGSDYQLLDRESCRWVYPEIVEALTE